MHKAVLLLIATFITSIGFAQQSPTMQPTLQNQFQLQQQLQPQARPNFNLPQPAQGTIPLTTPVATGTPAGTSEVTTVVAAGDKNLYATLQTTLGKIKIELFATITPRTVRNFVELANGQKDFTDVKTGRPERRPFYDGLIFHRVVRGFAIFTGCPFGTGKGGPGFSYPDEFSASLRFDKAGVVAMANSGPNTNGSQFFITLAAHPDLDDKFTIFGQVLEGMDVVRKIGNVKVGPTDRPLKRIYIKKLSISE